MPPRGIFINAKLFRRLQDMFKKLPLEARLIHWKLFYKYDDVNFDAILGK